MALKGLRSRVSPTTLSTVLSVGRDARCCLVASAQPTQTHSSTHRFLQYRVDVVQDICRLNNN